MMILRLWRGWTTPQNAIAYDNILNTEVAPAIVGRQLEGLNSFDVWTRVDSKLGDEREFLTVMRFEDMAAVGQFTGGDPHGSVVPPRARRELARFDQHSRHYELRQRHTP